MLEDGSPNSDKEQGSENTPFLEFQAEEQSDVKLFKQTSFEDTRTSHVIFTMPQDVEPTFLACNDKGELNPQSPYHSRAMIMRSKIEDKITEIEKKMKLSSFDLNTESSDAAPGPTDYNLITVMDSKQSRSCSISEMRQNTIDRLQSKLEKAEKDLELREEEVARLRKIRDEVGSEIEDLTASLFEEANNMVKNAYIKQHKAEKNYKEVNMKFGILQDEVRALKTIVQSIKPYNNESEHSKVKSTNVITSQKTTYEVDPIFNEEFVYWRQGPNLERKSPFMKRIYDEDVDSCLNFKNAELSNQVLEAIEKDKITIEKITASKAEPLPKYCALMDAPRLCPYKMCLNGKSYNISTLSRNRITAVCDLFCYFRYIQQGLISLRIHEVYLEVLKKRRRITSAKLGLTDDIIE